MELQEILRGSAFRHSPLCPRQVLGARAGIEGLKFLGVNAPLENTDVNIVIETDGCFADGLEIATGATVGHRTLRLEDYGKLAATFVHVPSNLALRLAPRSDIRTRSCAYAPDEPDTYQTQLMAYQIIPANELFILRQVSLEAPVDWIISQPGSRATCEQCGEEIINQREVKRDGRILCRACFGLAYYLPR